MIQAYKRDMGWTFPWASSNRTDFNYDYAASFTAQQLQEGDEYNYAAFGDQTPLFDVTSGFLAETARAAGATVEEFLQERPGMSTFVLEDGVIHHAFSAYARGLDGLWGAYQWLDRTPLGRNGDDHIWVHHDRYDRVGA